jgi:uncharacterized protein YndB with AHSA1/START domain/DNA-binding transcriptional ArsR family regulator
MVDEVFKALSDPARRTLLDALRERDGRTLTELETILPLTSFGVMRHVKVLEAANLVTSRKVGRSKYHYLNPVPIRLIQERWVDRFAEPFIGAMRAIKSQLEKEDPMVETRPKHVYELFIRTTPEKLWDALTNPAVTSQYWHGAFNRSDWTPGARWSSESKDGEVYLDGEILESDPPRRLVHTFHVVHESGAAADRPSRVTWEIEPEGAICRLRMVHDDFDDETRTFAYVGESGWSWVLSGLKTYLETQRALAS